MTSETVLHYLRNHPHDTVRVIEASRGDSFTNFIAELSYPDQAQLLTNLLPKTAATYLGEIAPGDAANVVGQLHSVAAAPILGALNMTKRRLILDALPMEKGTNIRHLLRYPEDSIGSLMLSNTLACRADGSVRHAKQIIRRFDHVELPTVVVVDQAMKPVGLLSVNKLLRTRERELVSEHMRFVPTLLRANASISSVLVHPIWETEEHVPVIEPDGRYVGLLPKASLHKHALAARVSESDEASVATTFLDIADMLWVPAADALARLSTTDTRTAND